MARPVTRRADGNTTRSPDPARGDRRPVHAGPTSRRHLPGRATVVGVAVAGLTLLGAGWMAATGGFAAGNPTAGSAAAPRPSGSALAAGSPGRAGSPSPVGPSVPASAAPGESTVPDPVATRNRRLQATLDRYRTVLNVPGVSATILFPDGTAWTGASGFAQVAAGSPVTKDTAFAIASMSKTFTSAEVLALVGEGRLSLTDSAVRRLPAGLPIKLDPRITVAMLLDHTSGLPDFFLNPKIDPALQAAPTRTWTPTQTLRFVGKPLSPPGTAWHYANTNYLLLGLIVEHVTGRTLAEEIRSRFLDPLGLSRTWYQVDETARRPLADGYRVSSAKATRPPADLADGTGVAPFRSVVTAAGGAGSIASTSTDLAQWARALYGGEVLGPAGTALLLSDFTKTTGYLPGVSYGFGIQALSIDGHPSLGHSGRLLGFRGAVRHLPIEGFTIAVLTNQSRADPAAIVRALLRVLEPPVAPVPKPSPSGSATAPPG